MREHSEGGPRFRSANHRQFKTKPSSSKVHVTNGLKYLLCPESKSKNHIISVEDVEERICGRNLERDIFHRTTIQSAEWTVSSPLPRPGDAIARSITMLIWHHGIYLGKGRVCHRTSSSPPVEVSMDVFLGGEGRTML